ncbi:MAG: Uma2 family endonuclease [Bacteroidota bacterium]
MSNSPKQDDLFHDIMEHPIADQIIERANQAMEKEARHRANFREWLTPSVKAEFINGEIVMHSPVKRRHLRVAENLHYIIGLYARKHNLGEVSIEKALIELGRNDYEPDLAFWLKERTLEWDNDMMVHPAPDFIIEILSESTKDRDRNTKYVSYESHGVGEYWIIDPVKELVEQFVLVSKPNSKDKFELQGTFGIDEVLTCLVLKDLVLPVAAIFDAQENMKFVTELTK